jgi:hypothetical protein
MAVGQTYTCSFGDLPPEVPDFTDMVLSATDDVSGEPVDPTYTVVSQGVADGVCTIIMTMLTEGTFIPDVGAIIIINLAEYPDGYWYGYILLSAVTLVAEPEITPRKIRLIPFAYSSTVIYMIEVGNQYMRFFNNDEVVFELYGNDDDGNPVVPYLTEDLYQIQYYQVGNVMRLVHSKYAPRTLTRTSAVSFSLDKIPFAKGPFMTRNDLIDPTVSATATMACDEVDVGEEGTLTFDGDSGFFVEGHIGALFKLVHPRVEMSISRLGSGESSAIYVKGTARFVTTGSWKGTFTLQRSENGSDWENFKVFTGLTYNARNDSFAFTEDSDNVQYKILASSAVGDIMAGAGATLTLDNQIEEGIVRVMDVTDGYTATVIIVTKLASNAGETQELPAGLPTKRWAEGAWSDYRGWPSTITFFEDRCIYGGMATIPTQAVLAEPE